MQVDPHARSRFKRLLFIAMGCEGYFCGLKVRCKILITHNLIQLKCVYRITLARKFNPGHQARTTPKAKERVEYTLQVRFGNPRPLVADLRPARHTAPALVSTPAQT